MKSKADQLDVDKLVPFAVGLNKLSNLVKNTEDKIPDVTNFATNNTVNAKINEVKNEIPSVTNSAATAALIAKMNDVINKIPNINNLATTAGHTAV